MDTLANIEPVTMAQDLAVKNKSVWHVLILTLLTLLLFALTSGFWTSATPAEALFFSELKELKHNNFQVVPQKLFGIIGAYFNFVSLWPLRVFSVFCAWVVLLCTYYSARKLYGINTAFLAALILLTIPFFGRYAILCVPQMLFAAIICTGFAVWFTGMDKPLTWPRWALLWLLAVAGSLCFGLAVLCVLILAFTGGILISAFKKQFVVSRRLIFITAVFVLTVAFLFVNFLINWPEQVFSITHAFTNIIDIQIPQAGSWDRKAMVLLNAVGLWLLAVVMIVFWQLVRFLRRKQINQPYRMYLAVWFLAALLPALVYGYYKSAVFLSALPPLAIFIAYYLDRYARYRNSQPRARRVLKTNAITLKLLLTLWGACICGCGIWLVFNLEFAWQREFYLQSRHLAVLIALGVFLIFLSIRSFWIIGRAYAYWGYIFAMLISFSLIGYGVIIPSRDILYTPYYFNHNVASLFPAVTGEGLSVVVAPQTDRMAFYAQYFMYADYPVNFVVLTADTFGDLAPALPPELAMTAHVLAGLGDVPYLNGYRAAYWEEVQGALLIVLKRFDGVAENPVEGLVLAGESEMAAWAPGYCWTGGYLIPYTSRGGVLEPATQVSYHQAQNLRILGVNLNEGFRDPYTFHWLVTAGRTAPRGAYTGLALHFQSAYINKHWPNGSRFQQWALAEILTNVQPSFTTFTGLNPQHERTRQVLESLLPDGQYRQASINTPVDGVVMEQIESAAFLRFYNNEQSQLAVELPLRK